MRILEREGSSDRHFRDPVRPHMISVRQKILERVSSIPTSHLCSLSFMR